MLRKCLVLTVLAVGLSGCALLPDRTPWVKVTPYQTETVGGRSEGYYASAKTAIARRDYAAALDFLHAARTRDPKDPRVLNALGVVYDKLGRFDLSSDYYARAEANEPQSPIVLQNLAVSRELQRLAAAPPAPAQRPVPAAVSLATRPQPAPAPVRAAAPEAPRLIASTGNILRLELPVAAPEATPLPVLAAATPPAATLADVSRGLTGHPLMVLNGSGRSGAQESVRIELARLGWTAKSADDTVATAARTVIRYPAEHERVARALSRTLPGGAQLQACSDPCAGISLILGSDALAWKMGPRGA